MALDKAGNSSKLNSSYFRPFMQHKYKFNSNLKTIKENLASNTSLASISGSDHNIIDTSRLMSLQEDARSHKISTQVIRQSLYKQKLPSQHHKSNCMTSSNTWYSLSSAADKWHNRAFLSLPVTPMWSVDVSPCPTPSKESYNIFSSYSRGTTHGNSPEPVDEEERGLASILKPLPRYISVNRHFSYNKDWNDINEEVF